MVWKVDWPNVTIFVSTDDAINSVNAGECAGWEPGGWCFVYVYIKLFCVGDKTGEAATPSSHLIFSHFTFQFIFKNPTVKFFHTKYFYNTLH